MTQRDKLLRKILSGTADNNISFDSLRSLLSSLGFDERIRGSHHIFTKEGVDEILNIQAKAGKGKSYQVKQVRDIIVKYRMGD